MSTALRTRGVTKHFGGTAALQDVDVRVPEHTITGLLGRNGAGKTTLMQVLSGQIIADSGTAEVFGEHPFENERVLRQMCFIREGQKYPDNFKVRHALRAAAMLFPRWDGPYAEALLADFQLPTDRPIKKLSRGMFSALGVVIGLASRAPLTFFDEPYLGLDAVSRQLFYDRLLADYAENPRTVLLSTHLIDEAADLIEHVVAIDAGRVVLDDATDRLRGDAVTFSGPATLVDELAGGRTVLRREQLGGTARATVRGEVPPAEREAAESRGLDFEPVSLQQLIVHTTAPSPGGTASEGTRS
ncbi:ABC transporter ATP-binding protein [Saccharopolyspora sp. HNM0983]|uniref:ABC transporter ATP-binding protein n=1 Tax=Saccharopolyspora montiporae TaxID=2781240 RepID=A0A929BAM2_9PSEU|nr:ABC transporter ATP-binding protein [Saccharopolyspora sp. HNM0983]MBE9375316.1 ABC transporter ATP-binding protein [Saccharopolyspora sp. HNM0983]